jgi:hypothetical protein
MTKYRQESPSTPEDTIAECERRINECHTLSETTVVPEYRQALSAMAKARMRIAQGEREHQAKQQATHNCLQVPSVSIPVCTENSNPNVMMVKAAEDRV